MRSQETVVDATQQYASQAVERHKDVMVRVRDKVIETVTRGLSPEPTEDTVAEAVWCVLVGVTAAAQKAQVQYAPQIACKAGCSTCCRQRIGTRPAEVVAIVKRLTETCSPEKLDDLRQRVRELAEVAKRTSSSQWWQMQIPCPLLDNHECSVYDVRPLTCFGWTSLDAAVCEQTKQNPNIPQPGFEIQGVIAGAAIAGTEIGLEISKLTSESVELVAALDLALNRPETISAWLRSENAFASAVFRS